MTTYRVTASRTEGRPTHTRAGITMKQGQAHYVRVGGAPEVTGVSADRLHNITAGQLTQMQADGVLDVATIASATLTFADPIVLSADPATGATAVSAADLTALEAIATSVA